MSLPTFTFASTADDVATALAAEIKGKNVLITGTSLNGIGFETARVLAKSANLVIITGYNLERLKLSEAAIKRDVPSANVRPLVLDLSFLAGVRKAAAEVNAYPEPLHVLIHNAAAPIASFKRTADGLETQIATNHVGPFLLTKLLASKLLAARTARYTPRVVFVSSAAQGSVFGPPVDFTDIACADATAQDGGTTYRLTKSANVAMAIALSTRSGGALNAYSLNPGAIYTNITQKAEARVILQAAGVLKEDGMPNTERLRWKTIPQGAATCHRCRGVRSPAEWHAPLDAPFSWLTSLDTADKPGAYLNDSTVANEEVAAHCTDLANREKLWSITEEIIGERFTFSL
ncbi:hypothetical protein GGX14DRAFT_570424 [Mycena pura]|uniref:Short-chain dehydrogenase/reductase family protein n=1 Tax=Mycena pura TaxID=153505 RepID=A0AAD6V7P1_9AGAR|nr:hypothetical protein GGX14DRAFT_570424 [Mycena pura]